MTAARSRRPARRPTCSSTTTASRCRSRGAVLSGRATGVPGVVAHARSWPIASAAGSPGTRLSPTPSGPRATASSSRRASPGWSPAARRRTSAPGRARLFREARRHPAPGRRPPAQPGLCRFPAAASPRRAPTPSIAAPTAARIVARTRAGPLAGTMTLADLAGYRPVEARIALPHLSRLTCSACRRRRRAASGCCS